MRKMVVMVMMVIHVSCNSRLDSKSGKIESGGK